MKKGWMVAPLVLLGALLLVWTSQVPSEAQSKAKGIDENRCFACHREVRDLRKDSKHLALSCDTCHSQMEAHLKNSKNKPVTSLELSTCGACHVDQHDSYYRVNWEAEPRKDKGQPGGRSPHQDKLLAPHGFSKEHNEPRAHAFMLVDQFVVDRFAGGRYQFKDPYAMVRPGKAWDVLVDTGKILPETAQAGNPVCLQCKTSDFVLKWKYMGDKDDRAKWDRTSDVHQVIKDAQNPMGCIQCHDPHSTGFRVIRDALIEAVERDGAAPYAADKGKGTMKTVSFRDFRKIGLLDGPKSNLLCGQCHVEYNCNPGFNPQTGERVTMASRLANHFPWKNVNDLLAHYDKIGFRDFKHAVTGASLIKMQHPELETYWGSVHEKAGVQCHQCHMPQEKNKAGKSFTSHQVIRPKHHVKDACMGCHPDSSVEEKLAQIQAVQNYTRNKLRKAEAGLLQLIDTYAEAKKKGVTEEVLAQARLEHEKAHLLWEWWTAENSDGFHNPQLARETLVESLLSSKRGVELLNKAMAEKK